MMVGYPAHALLVDPVRRDVHPVRVQTTGPSFIEQYSDSLQQGPGDRDDYDMDVYYSTGRWQLEAPRLYFPDLTRASVQTAMGTSQFDFRYVMPDLDKIEEDNYEESNHAKAFEAMWVYEARVGEAGPAATLRMKAWLDGSGDYEGEDMQTCTTITRRALVVPLDSSTFAVNWDSGGDPWYTHEYTAEQARDAIVVAWGPLPTPSPSVTPASASVASASVASAAVTSASVTSPLSLHPGRH